MLTKFSQIWMRNMQMKCFMTYSWSFLSTLFFYSKPLVTPCLQIVRMLATNLDIIA